MEKVKRILFMLLIFILWCQQYLYADVVLISDAEKIESSKSIPFGPITIFVVLILLISSISFFLLKATMKKNKSSQPKDISRMNLNKTIIYICIISILIIVCIQIKLDYKFSEIEFWIPFLIIVLSIIMRLNENKKLSNIFCIIGAISICIVSIPIIESKKIEAYNNQFLQHMNSNFNYYEHVKETHVLKNVEDLIMTTIENNKSNKEMKIIYKEKEYISEEELRDLLELIDKNKINTVNVSYDSNGEYICSITLVVVTINNYNNMEYFGLDKITEILNNHIDEINKITYKDINNKIYSIDVNKQSINDIKNIEPTDDERYKNKYKLKVIKKDELVEVLIETFMILAGWIN